MESQKRLYNKGLVIIEIILVILSIIGSWFLLNSNNLSTVTIDKLCDYLYEVICKLYDVFLVAIGVYIAVITFLASTKTPFSDRVKTNDLFKKLGSFILLGIINNLVIIVSNVIIVKKIIYLIPLCVIGIFSLIYFIGFIIISYLIYSYNIEQLVIDSEKENEDKELVISNIEHINNLVTDILNKIK